MKYWQALLLKQQEKGNSGLTIPFLIGSQSYLPKGIEKNDIKSLLTEMVFSNYFETCIRYCTSTKTFIIEKRKIKNNVYFPNYDNKMQSNFSVAILLKDDFGDDFENIIKKLTDEYQLIIDRKLFSAKSNNEEQREATWTFFKEKDIVFIHDSFKSLIL